MRTVFEFVMRGLEAVGYREHTDEVLQSTRKKLKRAVLRVNVFRQHRQTVQEVAPADAVRSAATSNTKLLVVDEAVAISLPTLKRLMARCWSFW